MSFSKFVILVAYVQEVKVSATSTHTFTLPVSQSSDRLCPFHRFCAFESSKESFVVHRFLVTTSVFDGASSTLALVMAMSLNQTTDTQSLDGVAWVLCFMCVHLAKCMCFCAFPPLKRSVGVFGAHGSSCYVPSYFPASVSI